MELLGKIVWKQYFSDVDDFGNKREKPYLWAEGWGLDNQPGIQSDYSGAIAMNMGLWEEYCEFHQNNGEVRS